MSLSKLLPARTTLVAILALLILTLGAIYILRWESIAWHLWQPGFVGVNSPIKDRFGLHNYHAVIEARPVADVSEDLSGLTYNNERNTLVTISNQHPLMIELDIEGHVLRKVWLEGASDMEGVTHVSGNRYIITNEREQKLILVEWPEGVERIDIRHAPQIKLSIDKAGNKGFEGASWDSVNNRLLIAKERNPKRVLAVHGFVDGLQPGQNMQLQIEDVPQAKAALSKVRDFSSLSYHDESGHLFLLSDESRMVVELDPAGNLVGTLALWRGFHGLKQTVPQAEGLTIGPDRTIYVVSEPNLFYVFKPERM